MRRAEVECVRTNLDLIVREYFQPPTDVPEISRFVSELRELVGPQGWGVLEAEALIRAGLGETDVLTEDIELSVVLKVGMFVAWLVAERMGLTPARIGEVILAAEVLTSERGWQPTLAS